MTNNRDKLRLCPFCGSKNIDPEGWVSCKPDGSNKKSGPACDDCGSSAPSIDQWNTRSAAVQDKECLNILSNFIEWVRSGHFYADYDNAMTLLGKATNALNILRG